VAGSDQRFGPPTPPLAAGAFLLLVTGTCGFPFGVAFGVTFQFVGHWRPFPTLNGNPLVWIQLALICHPPMNASTTRLVLKCRPRPTGTCQTTNAFAWCSAS